MFGKCKHWDRLNLNITKVFSSLFSNLLPNLQVLHGSLKVRKKNLHGLHQGLNHITNNKLENVCMTKLHFVCHAKNTNDKWCMLLCEHHYHPIFIPWKTIMPLVTKQTNLKPPLNSPLKVARKFTSIVAKLSHPPPLLTICKFKNMGTL
jgi:hypothetical protein